MRASKALAAATMSAALSAAVLTPPAAADGGTPTAVGTGGAIATMDDDATQAGLDILKRGGNAVDAAVAAAAVLGVTEPYACGIGGGGFLVYYDADTGETSTIDHREKAPSAMEADAFFEDGEVLPFDDARYSGRSAGVPGTVAGWAEAMDRFGTMSLADVLQPGIDIASDGFVVDEVFADQTEDNREYFADVPSSAETFLDEDGQAPEVGSVLRNPDLAKTYERVAKLGPNGFYRGPVAASMVDAVQNPPTVDDPQHEWRSGDMTMRDVINYETADREPVTTSYRGLDVVGMAPPSSGGSTVGEALNILENRDLSAMPREEALHHMLEASRYSFADRNAYVGDADHVDVPLQGLLSEDFAAERSALITGSAADPPEVEPGDPYPHNGGGSGEAAPGATVTRDGSTTHLSVSDDDGNVVSYTFTIESIGGNGIVVPGNGFLLNNELTDFDIDKLDHPNSVGGDKRPRSSMAPTIVFDEGEPVLTVGTPGGTTIITTVLQLLVERIDLGATLPEAMAAPRATQRNTETTTAESAFAGSPEAAALRARGHEFSGGDDIGAATALEFLDDGRTVAAAEPERRGSGSAAVVDPD